MSALRQNASLVDALSSAIDHGTGNLDMVPGLLKRLLREEAWRDFETALHQSVHHDRFESFIRSDPLAGLGVTPDLIERLIQDDPEALLLYREAMKVGQGTRTDLAPNFGDNITEVERGTSKAYGLERLQRERLDLYEEVSAGKRSTHSAMVEAGFRPRKVNMPVDDMAKLADALKRHLTPEQITALRNAL